MSALHRMFKEQFRGLWEHVLRGKFSKIFRCEQSAKGYNSPNIASRVLVNKSIDVPCRLLS